MTPTQLLDDWLTERENAYYDPLSRGAALPYAFIWKKWIDWLTTASPSRSRTNQGPDYLNVSQEDALAFLTYGPSPASKRQVLSRSRKISPVTRLRYAEVLTRIYSHAVQRGLLVEHPFKGNLVAQRPTERERGGQVLPPGVFDALQRLSSSPPSPVDARDAAIVHLLLECGLTSGELCSLQLKHVRKNTQEPGQFLLKIDGPRRAQRREVSTAGEAGPALQHWLNCRDSLGKPSTYLFRSTKYDRLSKQTLFALVYHQVEAACVSVGAPCVGHVGPGVIRNTVIVRRWRAGVEPAEICKALGLQDAKSLLRGLGHHLEDPVSQGAHLE